MGWSVKGTYMESCSCEAICPCIVLSPPTQGECSAMVAWKIDRGHDDAVKLDGLNLALLLHAPGKMHETKWKAAVYVDDRASDEQKGSLLKIFGGQAGGHPAALASFIGEMLGVRSVAISFEKQGKNFVVRIDDGAIADTELEPLVGADGGEVTINNHLLAVSPGQTTVIARSKRSRIKDLGWDWNFDGRQCMHAPFIYEG